jgi:nucleoside-diphosphate-sugar epimerase
MKTLVTGCAGFIGSHLVDKLLDEVIGMGLGYVKLFCKQKPLLKKCLRYFCKQKHLLKNAVKRLMPLKIAQQVQRRKNQIRVNLRPK